jgi:hypothetical protein
MLAAAVLRESSPWVGKVLDAVKKSLAMADRSGYTY